MAAITTPIAAQFALLDEERIADLNMHGSPAFYKMQFGSLLRSLLDVTKVLDDSFDSISGTPPNWGAGVANIAALKLVTAANRADKQSRVVEDNGLGGESIYVYDLQSTADADDVHVVTPTDDSTGRWLLAMQAGAKVLQVINKTGGPLTKGTPCAVLTFDGSAVKFKVTAASAANGAAPAVGVLGADLANDAIGVLLCDEGVVTGLDTHLASSAGAPVYLASGGGWTLTKPDVFAQIVGFVKVKHASTGSIRVSVQPMQVPGVATTLLQGLQSATDKWKQDNTRMYVNFTKAGASLTAATTYTDYPHVAGAAETVVSCKIVCTGTPSTQPTAGNGVTISVKKGATVVATKLFEGDMTAGTWEALTLSGTAADLDLAAGDSLTLEITQAGTARLGTGSGIVLQVELVPKAA